MPEKDTKFQTLVEVISRLREPGGCPWDQKQTVESFRPYLLEEMHELLEALDDNDYQHVKEELGDLLFQIIFLNNLHEERGHFSLSEVIDTITDKMIRRHPHVFGDKQIKSERELRQSWNLIKSQENLPNKQGEKGLFSFPKSLPALLRAQRVSVRAVASGFEWPGIEDVLAKLDEETNELREAISAGNPQHIEDEIGDMLFTMVNVARKAGLNAEKALQRSTDKFISRFTRMAELASAAGSPIEESDLADMQRLWSQVKKEE